MAKAVLFLIGICSIATLAILLRRRPGGLTQAAVAAMIFLGTGVPQIVYASRLKGSPTFGDVGRLNYLWYVANVPGPLMSIFPLPARLPSPTGTGQTLTPLDQARDAHPAIYDIDAPIPGTLPIWYDAGYWYRGVIAPLLPTALARRLITHTHVYLQLFGFLLLGGAAAAFAGPVSRRALLAMRPSPMLISRALAALAIYALVYVESRFLAAFALLLFAGLVPPWATDALSRRMRTGFAVAAVATLPLVAGEVRVDSSYRQGSTRTRANLIAALVARGVGPGSRIGFIGEAYDAQWARTARLRFVSLVPLAEAPRFWELDASGRAAVLLRMRQHGAQAIVAEAPALGVNTDGWERPPVGWRASVAAHCLYGTALAFRPMSIDQRVALTIAKRWEVLAVITRYYQRLPEYAGEHSQAGPTALVNVALYFVVFYETKLYADMGLQAVYFALSLYGWYEWLYGGENRWSFTSPERRGR